MIFPFLLKRKKSKQLLTCILKWSGIGFDFLFGDFPGVKGLPMVDFHPPGLDAFSGENSSLLRLRTTPADFGVRGVAGYKKNERIKVLVGFQFDE